MILMEVGTGSKVTKVIPLRRKNRDLARGVLLSAYSPSYFGTKEVAKTSRVPDHLHLRYSGGWQAAQVELGYGFFKTEVSSSMTNRVTYAPQDVQKMCKQAERDQETRKLVLLMERVKRQIAEQQNSGHSRQIPAPSVSPIHSDSALPRLPSRSVPLER